MHHTKMQKAVVDGSVALYRGMVVRVLFQGARSRAWWMTVLVVRTDV